MESDVLVPVPRKGLPRIVGPGRRERGYLARLAELEASLEAAELVERGSARRLDKMEQKERRLILALGALQRENELLREKLAPALPPPRRSFLARLLGHA